MAYTPFVSWKRKPVEPSFRMNPAIMLGSVPSKLVPPWLAMRVVEVLVARPEALEAQNDTLPEAVEGRYRSVTVSPGAPA